MNTLRSIALIVIMTGLFSRSALPATPVWARFSMDREAPRVGEAFLLTLEIRISGGTLDKEISIAALPPRETLQIRSFEELPGETETRDGQAVEVRRFRTWARVTAPGPLTLAPRLDGTLIQTSRSFFLMQEVRRPIHIPAEPFPIHALPLPEGGRPVRFSGLVGNYTFGVKAAPLDIAPGDLITLTFTIEGDWLPEAYSLPQAEPGPGLKVYPPKPIPEDCTPTRHVYRQIVIPEDGLLRELPAFTLIYYDTRTSRYESRTSGPFPITTHAERLPAKPAYVPPPGKSALPAVGNETNRLTMAGPERESWWLRALARMQGHKHLVIKGTTEVTVRFGPADSARALFVLPPGTTVREESISGDWILISCDQGTGWIPGENAGRN